MQVLDLLSTKLLERPMLLLREMLPCLGVVLISLSVHDTVSTLGWYVILKIGAGTYCSQLLIFDGLKL